jgi:hypothetical protein
MYVPDNRLGSAFELAEDIKDRDVIMQVLVLRDGHTPRLLTMRVCGRTRMLATDEVTGITRRVSVRSVWAVADAARKQINGRGRCSQSVSA